MEKIGWVEERNSEKLPEVRKSYKRLLITDQRGKIANWQLYSLGICLIQALSNMIWIETRMIFLPRLSFYANSYSVQDGNYY